MFGDTVPIVEVNRLNLDRLWSFMQTSVKRADFIAIDLELSGLGNFSHLRDKPFQERFDRIRESVQTRSILSIGLALFYLEKNNEDDRMVKMSCRVFNLMTMAARPFTVEPGALKFLSKHGFDFNKLIETAIPYELKNLENPLCQLFETVLSSGASVIFHNGFLDLAFLYHHLFCEIPASVSVFQSCVCDWFENNELLSEEDKKKVGGRGLFYDNKFIASQNGLSATFLEYVFRKYQRDNVTEHKNARICLDISFTTKIGQNQLVEGDIDYVDCSMSSQFLRNDFSISKNIRESICEQYSLHGCCRKVNCKKTHEVDLILDIECYKTQKKQNKRKRRFEYITKNNKESRTKSRPLPEGILRNMDEEMEETDSQFSDTSSGATYEKTNFSTRGCHRAGMDAFMTGFGVIFSQRIHVFKNGMLDAELANRTTSPGLGNPLPIVRSTYNPVASERHRELWEFLGRKKAENIRMKAGIK